MRPVAVGRGEAERRRTAPPAGAAAIDPDGHRGALKGRCPADARPGTLHMGHWDHGLVQVSTGEPGVPLPRNPKVAVALAARLLFQDRLFTVAALPLVVRVPFHSWVIAPFGIVHLTVQPVMAELPACTVTVAW